MDDEIIQEVRRACLKILEEVGFDMNRLMERLMREQKEHPERLVSFASSWPEERRQPMALDPNSYRGVIHGKTIVLEEDPNFRDGAPVTVRIEPDLAPGEGIRQSAGGWADDPEGLEHWLEETRRLRKLDRRENLP